MLSGLLFILVWSSITRADSLTGTEDPSINTFHMHDFCGKIINMKWKSIYTAEIQFGSPNNTFPQIVNNDEISYHAVSESCGLGIESWNFQNRIMFYFKELEIDGDCTKSRIEILDGPTTDSPTLQGIPRFICNNETETVLSGIHSTSNRHLYIRYHGNSLHRTNTYFILVVASFHEGTCNSYEQACANGNCIMDEVACKGHNPCGDYSDCPVVNQPQEVATDERHVLIAAIVAISSTLVLVFIGVVVFCKWYRIRRKNRRQRQYFSSTSVPANTENNISPPDFNRTVSEIEAEKRLAPPSYISLSVTQEEPDSVELQAEDDRVNVETCLSPNNPNPPQYACVMLHKDMFQLSDLSETVDKSPDSAISENT